ncbi:hypothetical protein TTHERM_00424430 (macronuclear) [Tetrahymena thermophila SB210]|uniref:EGF-like domain-containing protein n=1 Tax=Tetrahymena thermophila (strain SB210) TaxID=312017 RepID=Q23AL7_TETTS|nr:hypothetical protein TTHERM_00424430 [Tetrahymena thermophila SB210]EAR93475.2 hypothetical protein TTHERM_00424430 [Tetrahymena thermophila SB210]|eukprot:XP_001013720.2 hypothetical protein TTHERM_00424430 [Tetrahymena thermophila SB210]
MEYNLYLIQDYLTKVETTNSIFKNVHSVNLNNHNHIDQLLVSDISFIVAYDFKQNAFKYFDVQTLSELQSTGVTLPFVDSQSFLQYKNIIFIGTSQYVLTYISSSNKVEISKSTHTSQNSYTLPNYHIILYAVSYSFTYQVFQGSDQYLVNIQQTLNVCNPGCLTCDSITACNICSQPLYLNNQFQCISTCPSQFVLDISNNNCVCRSNSTLQNQSCPCNTSYVDINGSCLPCPQYCNTCTSQKTCSICQTGYLLAADGTCVSTCPTNFIPNQTKTYCVCRLNSTLLNLQCPCNTGYFDVKGDCKQCPYNCDVCISQTACSQCSKNYYLTVQQTCAFPCPQTFKPDFISKKCVCDSNRTLQNNLCPCNSSYVDINGECQPCSSNCIKCTSQTSCAVCQQSYYLTIEMTCVAKCPLTFVVNANQTQCVCDINRTLTNNKCVCNSGFIEINNICKQCPQNCNTCSSQKICTVCQIGYYLTADGICTQSCPLTFIVDSTKTKCVCDINRTLTSNLCLCNETFIDVDGKCQPCPQNCKKCSSQTICQFCQDGFYQTINQTCVSQCPNSFIVDVQQKKYQTTNVLHAKMDALNVLAHLHRIVCNTLIVVNNLNMISYHKPAYNVYGIFKQENVQILVKINNFMIHKNNFANNVFIMMENAKVNVLMVFTLTILFNVNSVIHNVNHVMGLIIINALAVNYHLFYKMTVLVLSANQENSQINNKIFVKNAISAAQPALDRIQITVYLAYKIKFYQKIIKSA